MSPQSVPFRGFGVSAERPRAAKTAWVSQECFVFVECEIKDNCLTLVKALSMLMIRPLSSF